MKNILQILALLIFCVFLIIYAEEIPKKLILENFCSWTLAYVLPGILVVIFSIFIGMITSKILSKKKWLKWLMFLAPVLILVGTYLALNPPYLEDYSKYGLEPNIENNQILDDFLEKNKSYNGLLAVVSADCPYCSIVTSKLSVLKDRVPEANISLLVFTTKQEVINAFLAKLEVTNLRGETMHNEKDALLLADGQFPAMIYLKDGIPVQFWSNDQFGYPALDWVESDLEGLN